MNLNRTTTNIEIESLWVDSISVKSQNRDWSNRWDDNGEQRYEVFEAVYDDTLDRYITPRSELQDGDWRKLREAGEVDANDRATYDELCDSLEGRYQDIEEGGYAEGPMMNYAYPLPLSHYDRPDGWAMAEAIGDLPLCVVEDENGWYLALTGGGMDLSWEICEAFMRLGFLPPAAFADLPQMSGRPRGKSDLQILAACERTFTVQATQAETGKARLIEKFGGVSIDA